MKHLIIFLLFLQCSLFSQSYYFPPNNSNEWETISPNDLGWCVEKIDTLCQFLEEKNTKAFIVLKDGKIVVEKYFDTFTQDSVWYWASAGKSLSAFLVGVAQEEGLLNIEDSTSDYLGTGWTSATPTQEAAIKIRHQLTMTTGLDDDVPDLDCLDSDCLNYLTNPDERWYYHNAPYRLVQDVVANASGLNFNQFTYSRLNPTMGFTGLWVNYVFYSKPRQAARFGSLILNNGTWNGTAILADQTYFQNMVNTSQNLNLSYGYLWWLNGKGSYRLPLIEIVFNTDLIPNAPDDLVAALGKNDQKIYVVPSENLVVVRMGNAAGQSPLALSSFDNSLWAYLSDVICDATPTAEILNEFDVAIFPNPVTDVLYFRSKTAVVGQLKIYNSIGKVVAILPVSNNEIDLSYLKTGVYFLEIQDKLGRILATEKMVKL